MAAGWLGASVDFCLNGRIQEDFVKNLLRNRKLGLSFQREVDLIAPNCGDVSTALNGRHCKFFNR